MFVRKGALAKKRLGNTALDKSTDLTLLSWRCNQGCGVGVEESESEGFSTWGVGVVENFNDSDSGQTFRSPIVTVCATNVRKRHTWQFKQLDASTRDDHGTCIPSLRGHFRSAASLGLITQPTLCECNRSGLVTLKFPFVHSGWHYRCSVTLATQQWMRVLMGARPLLRNARHRTMITPVNPPRLRLIHISPSY